MPRDPEKSKSTLKLLFLLYGVAMLWLLFARSQLNGAGTYWDCVRHNINLTPLHTITHFWDLLSYKGNTYLIRLALVNLVGNVAVFVPLGFFLPCLWTHQRKLRWFLPTVILLITGVELIQLFTLRGICDIDDLILNIPGILLGFLIFHLLDRLRQKRTET